MKPMSSKNFVRGIVWAAAIAGLVSRGALGCGGLLGAFTRRRPEEKVEFASNWYVRGDLTYAAETYPKIAPDSTFVSSPSVLNTYSAGGGCGYKVND
jgi:hypothetical protein